MPRAEFFKSFGLFVVPDFLDANTCEEFRSEIRSVTVRDPGEVMKGDAYTLDTEIRKTHTNRVSKLARSKMKERLLDIKPQLDSHFGVQLTGVERPQFLYYQPGDFYQAHMDSIHQDDQQR